MPAATPAAPVQPTVQVTGTVQLTIDGVPVSAPFTGSFVMPAASISFSADSPVTADSTDQS